MHFVYVDESGAATDRTQHYFVLAAIVIRTEQCIPLQEGLLKLKEEFHFSQVEVKGRDIEQSKNFFRHISLPTKREFVKRLFQLLFAHDLSLLAIVFAKKEPSIVRLKLSDEDVYQLSYKELLQHVEAFLTEKNDHGLLLIDSRASSIHSHLKDDRLIRVHQDYLKRLPHPKKPTRVIEYPVFVQSEFFAAIQLADLCAYHIFRALQLSYGKQSTDAAQPESADTFPHIPFEAFAQEDFLEQLFSHPEVELPTLAKLVKLKGKIVKLP